MKSIIIILGGTIMNDNEHTNKNSISHDAMWVGRKGILIERQAGGMRE